MFMGLLEWALRVVVAAFILLLLSLLLWFIWGALMRVFSGPQLPFVEVAIIAAVVSVSIGSWGVTLLRKQA